MKKSLMLLVTLALALCAGCDLNWEGDDTMSGTFFKGKAAGFEPAISADDAAAIAAVVRDGVDVNIRGVYNMTPLMMAVDRLKPAAVGQLLALGADPNLKADDEESPVSLAVANYRRAPEIMEMLFEHGGDPDIRRPNEDPVIMRFINDRDCERLRYMKSIGADLDITTRGNDPIITWASTGQDWDVVWCLIELGAAFDYEGSPRHAMTVPLRADFPSSDSPIYPYKVKVWNFLKEHGIAVPPLNR